MNTTITPKAKKQPQKRDYYEEGRLFEIYVKELFNKDSFRIREWRMSEKLPDGTYIADYSNPDLDLIFAGKKDYRFAVECKWRKQFKNGKINWATEKQIIAYKKFQSREAITVFIAIGVGGTASSPEKLFVTPLCNLENIPEVYEHQLIKYKRKPTQRFFYNTVIPGLT